MYILYNLENLTCITKFHNKLKTVQENAAVITYSSIQEELNSSKRVCINFRFLTSLHYAASVSQCSLLCSLRKVPLEDASVSTHTDNPDPVGTDLDSSHVTTMTLTYVSDNAFIKIPHLFKGNWKLKYYIIKNIAQNFILAHHRLCYPPKKNCLLTSFTPRVQQLQRSNSPKAKRLKKQWPQSNGFQGAMSSSLQK